MSISDQPRAEGAAAGQRGAGRASPPDGQLRYDHAAAAGQVCVAAASPSSPQVCQTENRSKRHCQRQNVNSCIIWLSVVSGIAVCVVAVWWLNCCRSMWLTGTSTCPPRFSACASRSTHPPRKSPFPCCAVKACSPSSRPEDWTWVLWALNILSWHVFVPYES